MDHSQQTDRRLLFYTLCIAYIATGILMILPGPTLPLLAAHTGVSLDMAGLTFTASALGFTVGALVGGPLSIRIGSKNILLTGQAVMCIMAIVSPLTHTFAILLISQFVLGICFGFMDVSINMLVTLGFQDVLGETLNNLHGAFGIGALVGPLLLSLALETVHEATWAFAAGSVMALVTIALVLRQRITIASTTHEASPQPQSMPSKSKLITHAVIWFMALQMFLYIGAEVGFSNWIATAISQSALVSLVVAAPSATVFWIGLTAGRLLGAQILKRSLFTENQMLHLCFLGGGLAGLIVALFAGQLWISFSFTGLIGLFLGPIFPSIMAIASRRYIHTLGIISSVMLFSAGASGLVLPLLVGIVITHIGISWGMALPALFCLLITLPFYFAQRPQRFIPLTNDNTQKMQEARDPLYQ